MQMKPLKSLLTPALIISALSLPFNSLAATLLIKNDDTANIEIIIEPGEGSLTGSSHQIKDTIKPKEEKTIEVHKDQFGNADIFSISGKVKMPSLYNKCSGLFMDKDYKVIFVGSKTGGTICYAEPKSNSDQKQS